LDDGTSPVLERLQNNLGLKAISLAIAIAAWAYLRLAPNPIVAAHFVQQLSVPITTTGLRADYVARYTEKQAVVEVIVPRTGPAIRPDDLRAVLDLQGRGSGVYNVPIQLIAPKLEVKSLAPGSVTLSLEKIEGRSLPVVVHYIGDLHRNVVVANIKVDPGSAILRAPSSDLARVSGVRVDVTLPATASSFDGMLRPIAIDERGSELAGIAIAPNLVRVRADFVAAQTEQGK
jgi:YbbR domain-containing protein